MSEKSNSISRTNFQSLSDFSNTCIDCLLNLFCRFNRITHQQILISESFYRVVRKKSEKVEESHKPEFSTRWVSSIRKSSSSTRKTSLRLVSSDCQSSKYILVITHFKNLSTPTRIEATLRFGKRKKHPQKDICSFMKKKH